MKRSDFLILAIPVIIVICLVSGPPPSHAKGLLHPVQQSENLANMPAEERDDTELDNEGMTADKGEKRSREVNLENISEQSDESTEFNYPAENPSEY